MLVDERSYLIRPGCMQAYLARHLEVALPILREHLGEPLGYFTSEEGELNQFVHLWGYADAADRQARRARLYADERWLAYRRETGDTGWVLGQANRLLRRLPAVARDAHSPVDPRTLTLPTHPPAPPAPARAATGAPC